MLKKKSTDSIEQRGHNNGDITDKSRLHATYSWDLSYVIPNPKCVKHFFEELELKGISLTTFARRKGINRSKLSQILHGLDVPKTPEKRKFWAEEVLGYDVQLFWIPEFNNAPPESSSPLEPNTRKDLGGDEEKNGNTKTTSK